jgi:hypothetical protein
MANQKNKKIFFYTNIRLSAEKIDCEKAIILIKINIDFAGEVRTVNSKYSFILRFYPGKSLYSRLVHFSLKRRRRLGNLFDKRSKSEYHFRNIKNKLKRYRTNH